MHIFQKQFFQSRQTCRNDPRGKLDEFRKKAKEREVLRAYTRPPFSRRSANRSNFHDIYDRN